MAEDLSPEDGMPLLEACDKYPYHELVAYACGRTIGELRDWLERGASAGDDQPGLRTFTREYCQRDANYAAKVFDTIWSNCQSGQRANVAPLWAWFEKRWPCQNPLAITTLLASERVEELSLRESFRDPTQPILDALAETGWFRASDLENPSAVLRQVLSEAGYRRESDARPEPRLTPQGE